MKKRWLKITAYISAAVVLLLIGAFILFQSSIADRFILERARDYLRGSGIDLQASNMNVDLLSGSLTLEDITVRSISASDLPPLFRASKIYARLNILETIRGLLSLSQLTVTAPAIVYHIEAGGRTNLPPTGEGSGKMPDFLIEHARLEQGSFKYDDLRRGISLDLPLWDISVDGDRSTLNHRVDFTTRRAAPFRYEGRSAAIDAVRFIGTLQKTAVLNIETARVSALNSTISASGSLQDFSNLQVDLVVEPNIDLRLISLFLGAEQPFQGTLSGDLRLSGKPEDLAIGAQLKGADIQAPKYGKTDFTLRAQARLDQRRLLVHSFDIQSPDGFVEGNAELSRESAQGTNSVRATLRNFDVRPAWKLIDPPFDLASRASGRISLQWKGALQASTAVLNAQISLFASTPSAGRNLLPVSGAIEAQMQSGRMTGVLRRFSTMGALLDGSFTLHSFRTVDASVQGAIDSAEATLAQVSRFLGSSDPTLIGIKTAGRIEFEAKAHGSTGDPVIEIRARAPDLQAGDLKNLNVETEATIQNSQASFSSIVGLTGDATIQAKGVLGLSQSRTTLVLDAETRQLPASAIASILGSDAPVSGAFNANLHVEGPVDALAGEATVSGDQISIYRERLGRFDAKLHIQEGEIRSEPFRINRDPANPDSDYIDTQFVYGLKSGQYTFDASGKNLKLPEIKHIAGTADLTASGRGTIDDPVIDLRIESQDIAAQQKPIGPLSVAANLKGGHAVINALAPRLNLSAAANIEARPPYPYTGELILDRFDVSVLGLTAANRQPLTGTVEAALNASGNLDEAEASVITAQIRQLQLRAGAIEAHTEGPVQAEYRDRMIEILSPAAIVSGNSRIEVTGRLPLRQASSAGSLTAQGQLDLNEMAGFFPLPSGMETSGIMNLDLSLAGTPERLAASGTITMDNGSARLPKITTPFTEVAIRASLQDGSLVVHRADAAFGDGRMSLTGEFPFGLLPKNLPVRFPRKEGPATFVLDLVNIRPEATGLLPREAAGLVSLRATGRTASMDISALEADVVFQDLSLKLNEVALAQSGLSTIKVRDGIATISGISLTGSETSIAVSGSAGLSAGGPLEMRLTGDFDAALLTLVLGRDIKPSGKVRVEIAAGGTWRDPSLSGVAEMKSGRVTLRNPRVIADSLNVRLNLTPDTITVQEFKGTVNGGSMTMEGTIGYRRGILRDFNLKGSIQDVFLEFPQGLRSASNGNFTISSVDDTILIAGTIRIVESAYRESFGVTSQIRSYLKDQEVVLDDGEANAFLDRIRFDLALRTTSPLLVQNNIAKLEATANLRLVGSFNEPSVVGRITLEQGGEIILNQRSYYIERGTVVLSDQTQIRPDLDIRAQTRVDVYDITLRLTGPAENFTTILSSEPPLPESEIVSLLLTGRTTAETRGRDIQMAQSQALSLIAGQAGEEVTREAREALHLSTFRIDPGGLIAGETDHGARITLGQDVTRNLNVAYSMNIVDGGGQIWAAQYRLARKLTTQATKQEDNSYRFELRHDLQFGSGASTRRSRSRSAATRFTIGSLNFEGNGGASRETLKDRFKLEPGDRYDFAKVQKGLDRLNNFYAEQNRLEASVRLQRETREQTVDLNVTIDPGPVVEFAYEGTSLSSEVRENVESAWRNGVFDIERLDNSVNAIRRSLLKGGYLQAEITPQVLTEGDRKIVRFQINPGTKYPPIPIRFEGASEISPKQLSEALDSAALELDVFADPQKVADYLKQFYRERGYIQAEVDLPQPQLDSQSATGVVLINVREGPLFTIGDLEFSGNSFFGYDQLWVAIPTSTGSVYKSKSLQDSADDLKSLYRNHGFNEVSVTYRIAQDAAAARANVTFLINERRQSIIRKIEIEGNRETSRDFIVRQLDFSLGDPLDTRRIDETRRRLYATAVYSSVDFQNEEIQDPAANPKTRDMLVRVRVREIRPYRLQYGFFYDNDRGPGGIADAQDLNFLGRATALGLRLRYDSDLKEARLYFNQPFVKNNFLKLDAAAFVQREDREAFSANRIGFSIIREQQLQRKYIFHYGYRYDHVRWNGVPPDPQIFQASDPVARLVGTLSRDTRDSILDATRGEFTSHSIEFGPTWLGSDIGFARYYGQYFRYVPLDKYLGKPTRDAEGNRLPASLVYAGALRLGLTSAFGNGSIISPERFFAGGGTTMRGFRQDLLGPTEIVVVEPGQDPVERGTGGEGLFLFNNEIRFPIYRMLYGVGFVDLGNVYERLSDFNFSLRKSAGVGLRIKIKFIPIRFDYGFKLDRRPGESRGAFFFSIGQAF